MQRYTMYPANVQTSDLFRRMMVENAGATTHESSDRLLQRMLDAAASQRPPIGLFDPREFGQTQTLHPARPEPSSDVFALGPNAPSSRDSGEAFVQRILDEAVSKRPPMGLFDSQEFGLPQAQTPADFRAKSRLAPDGDLVAKPSASDEVVLRLLDEAVGKQRITGLFDSLDTRQLQPPLDIQDAFPSANDPRFGDARGGPDAPVQRLLDDTAANRPPLNEVDPRGPMPWPTTYNATSNVPSADRPSGMISFIPPIAPPPGLQLGLSAWQSAEPVLRATDFNASLPDLQLAANALGRAAYQGIDNSLRNALAPDQPSTSTNPRSNPIPIPYGELTNFEIVKRVSGGGASDDDAYRHWYEGSGRPLRIEFSGADVRADLKAAIEQSAAGGRAGTFQNAINESLLRGKPVFVNATAPVDTRDIVRGRVNTNLAGWVTANDDTWQFDGTTTGRPEAFDFNADPKRGFLRNAAAIYVGDRGHLFGAKDYETTYSGAIQLRAGGPIRR